MPHFIAKATNSSRRPPGHGGARAAALSADLDTLVEFRPEAIFIERTLTLHREKGDVFSTALTLPAGEEVLGVRNADDSEPDWRMEGGKLRLRWSDLGGKGADRVFKIRTRIEPEKWTLLGADGLTFTLGDAQIDGAEKVTGYIALQADDSFRLEAEASETLERRDGRTTPVRGVYAWFRRGLCAQSEGGKAGWRSPGLAHRLRAAAGGRARSARADEFPIPLFRGAVGADPRAEGDRGELLFRRPGRSPSATSQTLDDRFPKGTDRRLRAEVHRASARGDGEGRGGIALHRGRAGHRAARCGARERGVGGGGEYGNGDHLRRKRHERTRLAARAAVAGISAAASRHRCFRVARRGLRTGAFRRAARAGGDLASVVDALTLDTVVSTSGTERSQAVFQVRTAGAQYLDVRLPEKSRLLSLSVDDALVKPVGERADQVRVQLPANRDASTAVAVSILYETPQGEWRGSGGYATRAPQLAKSIPILRSEWRLYLPDGFEYSGVESNLRVGEKSADAPLVVSVFRGVGAIFMPPRFGLVRSSQSAAVNEMSPPASEPVPAPPPAGPVAEEQSHLAKIQRKLEQTIIPKLEFREATISEALSFLRKKSVDLDPDDPKTGVNIQINFDEPPVADARITLSLTNIPLIEALKYVTGLANLKLKVEPYVVSVVPASVNTDSVITKEWNVRTDLIPNVKRGRSPIGRRRNG